MWHNHEGNRGQHGTSLPRLACGHDSYFRVGGPATGEATTSGFQTTGMILTSCQTDSVQLRYYQLLGKPSVQAIFD